MHWSRIQLVLLNLALASSGPNLPSLAKGFSSSTPSRSAGGNAKCVEGKVPVTISANNTKILLGEPSNQTVVTEIFQELLQMNSTIAARTNGGHHVISATFEIDSTLCFPVNDTTLLKTPSIQVLTHGIGLDKSYWDIAPGYSYVDAAAAAGYATLAYNRLGVGESDHPDPLQVVQSYPDVEILHGIVGLLKTGKLGTKAFKSVIGVGHSYGSIVQLAQTAKYPQDVAAAVLTGFVNNVVNLPFTVAANNPAIASINDPAKFGNLHNGYVVHDTAISVQLPFFRFPFFDQTIFDNQYAAKQTYTLGQQFTLPGIYTPAPAFKGPVDIVVGQNDFPFCLGQCDHPQDQAAATAPVLYSGASAGSKSYIVPDCGHYINAHYAAPSAYAQIHKFLALNGL